MSKLFRYAGSKDWLAPVLDTLVMKAEPNALVSGFAGSCAFEYDFARRHPEVSVVASDINECLVNCHRAYLLKQDALVRAVNGLSGALSRDAFYNFLDKMRNDNSRAEELACTESSDAAPSVRRAAAFIQFMNNSFSGKLGSFGSGRGPNLPLRGLSEGAPDNVDVIHCSVFDLLVKRMRNVETRTVWYLDPPYLVRQAHYGVSNMDFQHERLAEFLKSKPLAKWIVSYNFSDDVLSLYSGMPAYAVARSDDRLGSDRDRGNSEELLIMSPAMSRLARRVRGLRRLS